MTAATLAGVRGLFIEARPRVVASGPAVPPPALPLVAVLCAETRSRATASAVALALAEATGHACALAGGVGAGDTGQSGGIALPAAARAARRLRERGQSARAIGRVAWVPDTRLAGADAVGAAAGASASLARAVAATDAPAALAIPLARTDGLDRMLGWFDGIVVVREPDAEDALLARVLASLAELSRPVALVPALARLDAVVATLGLRAPAPARAAVAALALGRRR